jgi:rod shape-determining protein MreC
MRHRIWFWRNRTGILFLFLNGLALYSIAFFPDQQQSQMRSTLRDAYYSFTGIFDYFSRLDELRQENSALQLKQIDLQRQIEEQTELRLENIRLRQMLGLARLDKFNYIYAEVIGEDPTFPAANLVVNRGSRHGVTLNMAIISSRGLLGRIVDLGGETSIVQTYRDKNMQIACRVQRTRSQGMATWDGHSRLMLRYIPRSDDLRRGDVIITAGTSQLYPAGLRLGVVKEIQQASYDLFKTVELAPADDLQSVEEVFLVSLRREDD